MGESHPTHTEAFLSKARILQGTSTTQAHGFGPISSASSDSRPISGKIVDSRPLSALVRPDSGLGRQVNSKRRQLYNRNCLKLYLVNYLQF